MSKPELAGWLLAGVCCVVIPLALGYVGLALAGAALLALAWWVLRDER